MRPMPLTRHPLAALADRYGRRGAVLVILGVLWMIVGVGIELEPPRRPDGPLILHEFLPRWLRATLWAGSGMLATWIGYRRGRNGKDDSTGFAALMLMPLERALSYLASWAIHGATTLATRWLPGVDPVGFDRGWHAAVVWLLIVAAVQLMAGWPNPTPVKG